VLKECSSAGRASVSKTEGRGFESLHSCHHLYSLKFEPERGRVLRLQMRV
jgi:hypothetical protein